VRIDEHGSHFRETASWAIANALNIDAGAFEYQKELVRQTFRLDETRFPANPHHSFSLACFVFLDHSAGRVVLLRNFDSAITPRTAAVMHREQFLADILAAWAKLSISIARIRSLKILVQRFTVLRQLFQILRHQQILGFKMAVQRHFIGLRGSGDFVHAYVPYPA
jgi:hypothetical protein